MHPGGRESPGNPGEKSRKVGRRAADIPNADGGCGGSARRRARITSGSPAETGMQQAHQAQHGHGEGPRQDELTALVEKVAYSAVLCDPGDLTSLGELHTALQAVAACAAAAGPGGVGNRAVAAGRAVEQIVLREVDDVAAALRQVSESVADLVNLVGLATAPAGTTPAAATAAEGDAGTGGVAASAAAPVHPGTAGDAAEAPVAAEDLPLVVEFCAEASGHLEAAEAELLKLEADPDDTETVNAIFRAFHTIKGVAGFLNLKQIGSLAHAAESLLDLARKGERRLEGTAVDLVLESVDAAKSLVRALRDAAPAGGVTPPNPSLPSLLARLHDCVTGGPAAAAATPAPAARGPAVSPPTSTKPAPASRRPAPQPKHEPTPALATAPASGGGARPQSRWRRTGWTH
jgi:two-component system chemotaxis sensor kinase CheA